MKSLMLSFFVGVFTALSIVVIAGWLFRSELISRFSVGYEALGKPVELASSIQLFQNGHPVGEISRGAVVSLVGRATDSPMEYFSMQFAWENRGIERDKVYQPIKKPVETYTEMKTPFDP